MARSIFDDVVRRSDKFNRRGGKALRKSLGVKKRRKRSGKKRAKRNERHIQELAGQIEILSQQIASMQK